MLKILSGQETIESIRSQTDTILLAFSCGKDSIATWLECRKHFRHIVPFYMYLVLDLEFVERSLAYYEQWFGARIIRVPHPSFYRMLRHHIFQPPELVPIADAAQLPDFTYDFVYSLIRQREGLPDTAYTASGVRAVDSPYRLIAIKRYGPINRAKRSFYPIWDWHKDRLLAEITASGVKLPADYRLFNRSFDGIDYRFLRPIKEHYPADYRRILGYFPLAELEIQRREYARRNGY